MTRTLIVDDEPLARQEMKSLLSAYADIEVVGEASNAIDGISEYHRLLPDLLFVDIQMPKITGLEMVSMLDQSKLPKVVFVTAFDHFAVEAFEKNAIDYLLKPVSPERLAQTLERIQQQHTQRLPETEPLTHLPCFNGKRLKVVEMSQVEYVFSDLSGVHVASKDGLFHTQLTLKVLEQQSGFIRCHKQYLLNPNAIAEIILQEGGSGELITHSNHKIPVSRRYLRAIKKKFGFQ